MDIIIFSNIPSPYFVDYLNELGKIAEVKAFFERNNAKDRDSSWNHYKANSFKSRILGGIKIGPENAFSPKVISIISKRKNEVVVFANPMTPTGILGILYCQRRRIPYVLQSEGGFVKDGKGFKEKLKRRIVSRASLCLSGMKSNRDYFIGYGALSSRIVNYPFSSLYSKDIPKEIANLDDKSRIKKKLGINSRFIVLYVGRMLHVKGVDILVNAARYINKDATVVFVGGEPTSELSDIIRINDIANTRFIKHLQLDELKEYYFAADVFVLPTRSDTWGLVINEAMAYGLPIVTTDMCIAGLELIENGINGYIVKSEDAISLAEKVNSLLSDSLLRVRMGQNNNRMIQDFSYENMARIIYKGLEKNAEVLTASNAI